MKRILYFAALLLTVFGCKSESEASKAMKSALVDGIKAAYPEVADFKVNNFEVRDQVSFSSELARRIALMNTKLKAEEKVIEKYQMQGKYENYKTHLDAMNRTQAILEDLENYKAANLSKADSVVYYIVDFSGTGRTSDNNSIAETTKTATVSSDFKVYRIQDGNNPYKGMGVSLPGYLELLASHHEEQQPE